MGSELSMGARLEITAKHARAYVRASKKDEAALLDEVVAVTCWSRDNAQEACRRGEARFSLCAIAHPGQGAEAFRSGRRGAASSVGCLGGLVREYLAVSMEALLDALERHGELIHGKGGYAPEVRAEVVSMSAAAIDRRLKPTKDARALRDASATKPSPLLRSTIMIRKAGDEAEAEPGFFEGDTVAHCGPTLQGEFVRALNLTDMHTGWVCTRSMRNSARVHVQAALNTAVDAVPFAIAGMDFDNGSEFMNHDIVAWCAAMGSTRVTTPLKHCGR